MDHRARASLEETRPFTSIFVAIEVGFSDLSAETYSDLDECLQRSSEDRDPQRMSVTWYCLSAEGVLHEVDLSFTTDLPLDSMDFRRRVPDEARIKLAVTGESRKWVRAAHYDLVPLLEQTRLPRLYRFLEIFRHDLFILVFSGLLGGLGWVESQLILSNALVTGDQKAILNRILSQQSLAQKFDLFVRNYFSSNSSFAITFLTFTIPLVVLWSGYFLGQRYLCYLVPRSALSFGLSARRLKDYMNVFRLVVFTIFTGVFVGVCANFVYQLVR
jgi:hypothetical protein